MRWLPALSVFLCLNAAIQACDAVDLASAVPGIDLLSSVEEAKWAVKVIS